MTVRGNIQSAQKTLSPGEKQIANFMLRHSDDVLNMSVQELAEAAKTSASTVSRFARRLNFSGYNDLKLQLSSDLSGDVAAADLDAEIRANESLPSIKAKLLNNVNRSLKETADQIHQADLDALLPLIHDAKQLLIFGVGASYLVAQDIAQKWLRHGYACIVTDDLNQLLPLVVTADPAHAFLWLISNSGESPEVIMPARMAQKSGLKVVTMTKIGNNSLSKYANIAVQTSQPLEGNYRFAATQSLHAQFMLVDVIYYAFVSRYYKTAKQSAIISRDAAAEYKRALRDGM